MTSSITLTLRLVLRDVFFRMPLMPVWWYTSGWVHVLGWAKDWLRLGWRTSAVSVWIKNWTVPMYGDTAISGRIISFFVRTAVIFGRGLGFVLWLVVVGAALLGYLLALPIAILLLIFHIQAFF